LSGPEVPGVVGSDHHADRGSTTTVPVDLPRPHPPRAHRLEVIPEHQRHDRDRNGRSPEATAFAIDRTAAAFGVRGDDEDTDPRLDRAAEGILERAHAPTPPRVVPPQPTGQGGPAVTVRLEGARRGLWVGGQERVGRHSDRNLLPHPERCSEEGLVADVQVVERAPEHRAPVPPHASATPSGSRY
jgi:hypothetical protein